MGNKRYEDTKKQPIKKRTKKLLSNIGSSFRYLRKQAGYGNSTDFAIDKGIPEGSYGKHEAGIENMTIGSLVSNMIAHGLKDEDVFNKNFLELGSSKTSESLEIKVFATLAHQVRTQLKKSSENSEGDYFDDKDYLDIHKMLIEGKKTTSKTNLFKSIQLKSKTKRFENLLNLLISIKWIAMTHPENLNHPGQKYYTTEAGKEVLRLRQHGEENENS